ncbi:hypothetical protein PPYR_00621 [Photinus pyralis]|uniref:UBA domain-containing protein n=1 Tax=Photinus pyralis TaxID=7054 RepID=A0A1Y1L2U3_PHOPY|nr:hypothetical protein PPYR_00621 [Photinus pyralis]
MSSTTRTTIKGGKSAKGDSSKSHKHDKSDTGKGSDKQHGGGENARSKTDDPGIKEKVRQVTEMTRRSEEEVCLALYECDYDAERAINMLYENFIEGEWETSSKKKKNRQASTSKTETEEAAPVDEWNETPEQPSDKEKPRNKNGGGPPRLHGRHNDNRGWRGRENKENERNLNDGNQQDRKERRGRGGHVRGGPGRGRGGGRAGSRYPPRNNRSNFPNARPTIETWDNSIPWESTTITNSSHTNFAEENWDEFPQTDDWSTEEYTGSLADTKVFTPSMAMASEIEANMEANSPNVMPSMTIEAMDPPMVGSLNAAQTQYFNQLTQQSNENVKAAQYSSHQSQSYDSTSQPYNTAQTYANNNTNTSAQYNNAQYGSSPNTNTYSNNSNYVVGNSNYVTTPDTQTPPQHHPVRTKAQRARVPPPSKIPSSAVEMPGDINSSIAYLDVQFGAMDFISDASSFDGVVDNKFSPTNDTNLTSTLQTPNSNIDLMDLSQSVQNPPLDVYASKPNTQQSSITTVLSQNISNADTIPQANEHLTASYTTLPRSSTVAANATQTITPAALELNKQSEKHSYSQSSSYNSYQPKTTTYQNQNYSSSSYSTPQTTANSYVNSNTPSYNTQNAGNAYQNSYSSVSSYQTSNSNSSTFPAISQANSYPANNQFHQQTSQSVYGGNTGLNSNSSYGNATSGNQYSSYNTSSNKSVKESNYDGSTTSVSSTTTVVSSINNTSSLTQTTSTGAKSTTALAKNTNNNVMSNIPPAGVTPVMSTQYIMSNVPFFQQPIYSFEEMQLLQQRMPHMTGYYDMSYQTPTTLTAVRDGTLANVAYSISDGRFTRGDNNTSPVPSTLSQQTSTGHQAQPMLAAQTGAAPFFYAPYNALQPTYQFPVYPQLPTVTNAHGSNNSQYPKPATYGSGYGSGYDPLTQTQDYSKGGYVSNTQSQSKGSGANASTGGSSANDLTAIYGKSHTALGKVNSYDKQGFHSGTPPPFPGTLHGNQSTALAPSGTNFNPMYISTMPPQQHHSTPLIHQPIHQMEVRQGRRMDSTSTGQRSQASSQAKSGAKQNYPPSYWNQA